EWRKHERAPRQGVAADRVEYDVDPAPAGELADSIDVVCGGEVDRVVRAERTDEIKVIGECRRDDPRSDGFRDLDRDRSDATGTAMDEDCLADAQSSAADEGLPDGPAHERQACCLDMRQV